MVVSVSSIVLLHSVFTPDVKKFIAPGNSDDDDDDDDGDGKAVRFGCFYFDSIRTLVIHSRFDTVTCY